MAEIIIDQTDLNLTITPNTTQLNVFTGGYACAQGNTTEFQYNNGGVLAGANGLTYNSGTQTTTAANLNVTNDANLGAVGNVTITGGNINQFLQTDGSGILSFADIANANYANHAGTVLDNAQPNITSLGNLSNLTVTGNATANFFIGNGSQLTGIGDGTQISNGTSNVRVNSANGNVSIGVNGNANILVATANGIVVTRANLGSVSNLTITGGTNGYVLQTDGTGNLTWTAGGNVTGNGVPGGANTQIQFNDGGLFGGKAGFTFDRVTDVLNMPGNLVVAGLLFGDGGLLSNIPGGSFLSNGNSNIGVYTANGNATISVAGNANIVTVTGTGVDVAGYANISGNILAGNANISGNILAGNVYANSGIVRGFNVQGNTCNIVGNIVTGNANLGNAARANFFIGSGNNLSNIQGANVTGAVANATYAVSAGTANTATTATFATSATTAGTVTTAAQPNITSVGTLTGLSVNGTITGVNITANTGVFTGNGNGLSSLVGANVTGTVASATAATNASALLQNTSTSTTVYPKFTTSSANGNTSSVFNTSISANLANASITATTFVGALSGAATTAGTVTTNAQPNITSVGTLTSVSVTGTATAGNLSTTGNLSVSGNANIGNIGTSRLLASANVTSPQFISNASAGISPFVVNSQAKVANLNADLLDDYQTSVASVANTIVVRDNNQFIYSTVWSGSQSVAPRHSYIYSQMFIEGNTAPEQGNIYFITGSNISNQAERMRITLSNVDVNGNFTANLITANTFGNTVNANYFVGDGSLLTNLSIGGNVTYIENGNSNVFVQANANIQFKANGVSNVFVVGPSKLITQVQVESNVATGNAPFIVQSTTQVANLNVANAGHSSTANTVVDSSQPNITSIGNLLNLNVTGNILANNITANTMFNGNGRNLFSMNASNINTGTLSTSRLSGNYSIDISGNASIAGTVTANAQPNITSVGNLTDLTVNGTFNCNGTATIGNLYVTDAKIHLGSSAGNSSQANRTIAIGVSAGNLAQADGGIAIGANAGGYQQNSQLGNAIAIGHGAGRFGQEAGAIAIGLLAGTTLSSPTTARQGEDSIAIGARAGSTSTANTSQPDNSIVINATGTDLNANIANTFFVKPIRGVASIVGLNQLYYNSSTGEIVYKI